MIRSDITGRNNTFWAWVQNVKLLLRAGSSDQKHFAFLFSEVASIPPSVHNIKVYYFTQEMLRRGMRVSWIFLGESF